MPIGAAQNVPQGDKRLDIASRADRLDDNVEARLVSWRPGRRRCWSRGEAGRSRPGGKQCGQPTRISLVDGNVDAAIVFSGEKVRISGIKCSLRGFQSCPDL